MLIDSLPACRFLACAALVSSFAYAILPAAASGTFSDEVPELRPAVGLEKQPCAVPDAGYTFTRSIQGVIGEGRDAQTMCVDVLTHEDDLDQQRRLRIYTHGHELLADDNAVMCAGCGGVKGDPFRGLDISHGELRVTNYGGSRTFWGETWVLTLRHGKWILAGWDSWWGDGLGSERTTENVNALVGKVDYGHVPPSTDEDGKLIANGKHPLRYSCVLPAAWRLPPVQWIESIRNSKDWQCPSTNNTAPSSQP